ncbi:hypothetical protein Daus18300_007780 [Diaporthe australafricana]|uniref:Chromo domain-containing protein n=1 Tax=Diaporthe australafricana TaxID=127596 RepID=A0ABR3WLE8_9PEZI
MTRPLIIASLAPLRLSPGVLNPDARPKTAEYLSPRKFASFISRTVFNSGPPRPSQQNAMPPLLDDEMDGFLDDVPFPIIGSDIYGNDEDDEEPLDSGPVIPDILKEEVVETVVRIENGDEESDDDEENNDDDDQDIENGISSDDAMPEAPMDMPAPVSAKKRGRAAKGASRVATPAKKGPKAAKAAVGRKRKAEEEADEPAAKRPGRGRATAAAAREGIKEASKKRPRAAPSTAKEAPKAGRGRPGRKPKVEKEEPADEEYEVEKILDSEKDAKSKQALFLVKWKGYGEEENTWEPKTNLMHAKDLLKEYEAANKEEAAGTKEAKKEKAAAKKSAPVKKAPAKDPAKKPAGKAAGPGRPGRGRPKRN